jgi:hypothetical protein
MVLADSLVLVEQIRQEEPVEVLGQISCLVV